MSLPDFPAVYRRNPTRQFHTERRFLERLNHRLNFDEEACSTISTIPDLERFRTLLWAALCVCGFLLFLLDVLQ